MDPNGAGSYSPPAGFIGTASSSHSRARTVDRDRLSPSARRGRSDRDGGRRGLDRPSSHCCLRPSRTALVRRLPASTTSFDGPPRAQPASHALDARPSIPRPGMAERGRPEAHTSCLNPITPSCATRSSPRTGPHGRDSGQRSSVPCAGSSLAWQASAARTPSCGFWTMCGTACPVLDHRRGIGGLRRKGDVSAGLWRVRVRERGFRKRRRR